MEAHGVSFETSPEAVSIEVWAPGACFARAKARTGKLAWYSKTENLVILLELKRVTLSPRNNNADYNWLADHGVGGREFEKSVWFLDVSLSYSERWLRFIESWAKDAHRKEHKEHMLDFLYVKFLSDKIEERVFRVQDDPFWTGELIL